MEIITGRISSIDYVDPDSGRKFTYSIKVKGLNGKPGILALVAMTDVASSLKIDGIYQLHVETVPVSDESIIMNHYITRATSVRQ